MKKSEKLLAAMGEIDEKFISEGAFKKEKKENKNSLLKKLLPAAACFVLIAGIAGAGLAFFKKDEEIPPLLPDENPPVFEMGDIVNLGMGFEGYLAHDISELVNANPWTSDSEIKALPVFENTYYDKESGNPKKPDFEAMKKRLSEICERMGIDSDDVVIQNNYPPEDVIRDITEKFSEMGQSVPPEFFAASCVYVVADGVEITVDSNLEARIDFKPAKELPPKYSFRHYGSYEEASSVSEYLEKEYKDIIGFNEPAANVYGGDFTFSGEQGYQIEFFDKEGSAEDNIINYNFNTVSFACNDAGALFITRVNKPDLSEKIGNYPIISEEEAKNLLIGGNYITTCDKFPGEEFIKKAELVYRTGKYEKVFLPYYRFYVELPELKSGELNCYGAYYVPAVEEKYISDMPLWDGRFN